MDIATYKGNIYLHYILSGHLDILYFLWNFSSRFPDFRLCRKLGKSQNMINNFFRDFVLSSPSAEALGVTVTHGATTIRLIVLSRPPKTPRGTDFFNDFAEIIDQYSLMSGQLLIVGDYNIHWDRVQNATTKRLIDLLDSTNLVQHVSEPTHRDGHII